MSAFPLHLTASAPNLASLCPHFLDGKTEAIQPYFSGFLGSLRIGLSLPRSLYLPALSVFHRGQI